MFMKARRIGVLTMLAALVAAASSRAMAADPDAAQVAQTGGVQTGASQAGETQAKLDELLALLAAHEARIKELESRLALSGAAQPAPAAVEAAPAAEPVAVTPQPAEHEHSMSLPGGGPVLKIRGFADVNLGFGSVANSLIFPLVAPGTTIHNTFQLGEMDLFLSSKLSKKLSFVSELVLGSDSTNSLGLDVERLQLTYKVNPYFSISGGRYHSAIGFYNTAYHHGTWFQTATGRPFMYYFEDSGGLLPVHSVGVTATGLVPGSGNLELHWIAELSNGRSSDPNGRPVQIYLSDKNHKAFNLAAYVKPHWAPGLQAGGSFYRDRLIPAGVPHVDQSIASAYAVFINSSWELLNEVALIHNRSDGVANSQNTPLMYAQASRKFGKYRPYFRYQYVNAAANDPANIFTGRYQGPSTGLRMDYSDYAALKVQYNRLYQRNLSPGNGVDLQVAFAF